MSSKIVFDSNIWIGYFNRDDVHHKAAVDLITHSGEQDIYIPEYVVLESVSILKMRQSEKVAKLCLDVFLHTGNIHIVPSGDLFTKTINLFQTLPDKSLSFVDMSLLALSRDYEVKTFDKKLAAAIKKLNR